MEGVLSNIVRFQLRGHHHRGEKTENVDKHRNIGRCRGDRRRRKFIINLQAERYVQDGT